MTDKIIHEPSVYLKHTFMWNSLRDFLHFNCKVNGRFFDIGNLGVVVDMEHR